MRCDAMLCNAMLTLRSQAQEISNKPKVGPDLSLLGCELEAGQ